MLKFHKYLLHYNFFIATCSLFFLYYFSLVFHRAIPAPVYVFTFFSTLFTYNLFRNFRDASAFVRSRNTPLFSIVLYSVLICVACYVLLSWRLKILYVIMGIITLWYKFPLNGRTSLRNVPFLKLLLIALVWVLSGAIYFLNKQDLQAERNLLIWSLVMQFLFFIAITIPFDIFDADKDAIKTIPRQIGKKKAKFISYACIVLYLVIACIMPGSLLIKTGYVFVTCITCMVLLFSSRLKNKFSQYYMVDGLIILQTLVLFISQHV